MMYTNCLIQLSSQKGTDLQDTCKDPCDRVANRSVHRGSGALLELVLAQPTTKCGIRDSSRAIFQFYHLVMTNIAMV